MVDTIKFSQFVSGGNLPNDVTTVGLNNTGSNTKFNNPWTFLAPGTTGDRPPPTAEIYYRLRFNTTLEVYEYFDPTVVMWIQLSGSGTGTVNPGTVNDIAFYAANGTAVSPIASAANAVLVSNAGQVPSMSTTLPTGLNIPGATITSSTAALLSGSVVAAPVAGTDITNKTYVDSLFASGVDEIIGTTNQVYANGVAGTPVSGNVTLSLPQDIALGSTPTFGGLTLTSIPLGASSGGTGNNTFTAYSVICAGTTSTGAFQNVSGLGTANQVLVSNGAGALPSWQSVPGVTPAALTKVDDTNVTLTLGGTPASALLQATSITAGWTGQLSLARGGTNANLTASNGGIFYSTATAGAILSGTATAGQHLQSGASSAPSWTTATFPSTATSTGTILRANGTNWVASTATFADTYTASNLLYSNGSNTVTGLATANSATLVTNSSGVPAWSSTMTNGQLIIGSTSATPTAATLTAGTGVSITNGAASITISASGGGLAIATISGTSQAAAVNTTYTALNSAQTTVTLPSTYAVGDIIVLIGATANTGGWVVTANTGDTIRVNNATTSAGGSVTSAAVAGQTISLVCDVANTSWVMMYTTSTTLTTS